MKHYLVTFPCNLELHNSWDTLSDIQYDLNNKNDFNIYNITEPSEIKLSVSTIDLDLSKISNINYRPEERGLIRILFDKLFRKEIKQSPIIVQVPINNWSFSTNVVLSDADIQASNDGCLHLATISIDTQKTYVRFFRSNVSVNTLSDSLDEKPLMQFSVNSSITDEFTPPFEYKEKLILQ